MKVKIIKNAPISQNAVDISRFVGNIYNAKMIKETNNVSVDFGEEIGTMTIYKDEYEVVEDNVRNNLDKYFRNYQRKYNFCNDDVVDGLIRKDD